MPIAIFALPESIHFLVARGDRPNQVAACSIASTGKTEFDGGETFVISEEKPRGFTVGHLFREGRAINTALLWIVFFCGLLMSYSLNSWLPMLLREAGVPLGAALILTGSLTWSGVVGHLVLGPLVDRVSAPGACRCSCAARPCSSSASACRAPACRSWR